MKNSYLPIAVVMSTYNGEKYVKKQIDSILCQEKVNVFLFVRDDGSTDKTLEILKSYKLKYPENIKIIDEDKSENIGIKESFFSVIYYVYKNYSWIDYFSFSDQDDVWKSTKLIEAYKQVCLDNNVKGILYYSNKTVVDSELNVIENEDITVYNDFYEALWDSLAFGCTMFFNRRLASFALKHKPDIDCLHDSWFYRVAKSIGATIVFDSCSFIMYRQHGDNSVGIKGAKIYHDDLVYMIKRFIPVLFIKRKHHIQTYMSEIYTCYYDELDVNAKRIIQYLLVYRYSLRAKMKLIFNSGMKRRNYKMRMVWAYKVLFNIL